MNFPIQLEIILWVCVAAAVVGFASMSITLYISTRRQWKKRKML